MRKLFINIFLKKINLPPVINIKEVPIQGANALIPGKILFSENPNADNIIITNPVKKKNTKA